MENPIIIERIKTTTSTNDDLKSRARLGEKEITVLVADEQTKGKGTKGRSFYSPNSTGIYMSFLLRPELFGNETTFLTTMAAVALCEAIENLTELKPQIKWVNDIYIGGKKVAGILTEGAFQSGNKLSYAIVGIGLNLSVPDEGFPKEISDIAGALGVDDIKEALISQIVERFVYYYRRLPDKEYMTEYKNRLFFLGQRVTVTKNGLSYIARAVDVDHMCHLIVQKDDGTTEVLNSGEISVRQA